MGLDKLKIISPRRPQQSFIELLNDEIQKRPEARNFEFQFRYQPDADAKISEFTPLALWTKPGVKPFFRIELQFMVPGGKLPPLTTIETNPNKFPAGYRGLCSLVEIVFGEAFPDLKISRIDCNADVPDVSVEYIRSSLRIPGKRKTGDVGRLHESFSSCGVQTFYVGKSPAQLRVYDKIEELKYQRADTSQLPNVLTRVEWEFRERRCPVRYWGELPQVLDLQPFARLQFLETEDQYNFRYDPKRSLSLFAYNELSKQKGAHEAARIFNKACGRHFSRYLASDVTDNADLRERVHHAWHKSTTAFFENRCADVQALYQPQLSLNSSPPIEFTESEMRALLGLNETQAHSIAAAGRPVEQLQEARVFDQTSLLSSPLFDSAGLNSQLSLLSENNHDRSSNQEAKNDEVSE